ncbi:host cell division inhibitor Icd-like protein [Yersinia enterocolitica]
MMPTTPAASQEQAFPLAGTLNRLSLSELQTKHRNSPSLPAHRNLLIKLNCAEMEFANSLIRFNSDEVPESGNSLILAQTCRAEGGEIKGEQCSGSVKPENYSGSAVIQNECNNENQQVITCSQLSPLVGVKLNHQVKSKEKGGTENTALWGCGFYHHEENQQRPDLDCKTKHDPSNLRNDNANLRNYKNQHIAEQYARTYEILVGHRVTVSKPVQPFGSISRCLSSFLIRRFIQAEIDSSPSFSIASRIACSNSGSTRKAICLLPLGKFVFDTCHTLDVSCLCQTVYITSLANVKQRSPEVLPTPTGPLTTNVNVSNEVAMLNHTPTRFKFLFLAVCRSDLNAKPHRESVTANSEQDARRSLAGQFVLSFAGRLPEVSHG